MNKKYLISGAVLSVAAMVSLVAGNALAQSYTTTATTQTASTAQIAGQVSMLSTMVSELASIEAGRQAVIGNVGSQLGQIGVQVQGESIMPENTTDERAAIAANLSQLTGRISNLSLVIQGVTALGNQEASIMGGLQAQLLVISNELR